MYIQEEGRRCTYRSKAESVHTGGRQKVYIQEEGRRFTYRRKVEGVHTGGR